MAKILLVDDDKTFRETLGMYLRDKNHVVTCASNGKDALAEVLKELPDLLLLDLFMPEMDGGLFLEVVRSYLRLQSLPVIIMTGLPDCPVVERARALKASQLLVKGEATLEEIDTAIHDELHRIPK